nr:tether containing ubx domain for glut4 [Quercus suber]
MSTVFVVDASFKRTQVKVTPSKSLREILEEACSSRKISPESYTLKTQTNKQIDLSQPFRLSGLSAGAKLQLVQASRSPTVVSVALQLPDSEGSARLSDKFASSTSLWLILRKYEDGVAGSEKKLNLTQRGVPSADSGAGRLLYEQPCIHLMGRNLETFTDLQKTLGQLGLNGGNALLRLTFKPSPSPLEEAMQEITTYFTSLDTVPSGLGSSASQGADGAHANTVASLESRPNASAENAAVKAEAEAGPEPNEDVPMIGGPIASTITNDIVASSSITEPSASGIPDVAPSADGIVVYRPPSSDTPAAALQPDDPTVFEPSIDHAKAHQAALNRSSRNTRLLSDKELEEQEQARRAKLALVQDVVVRVRYPDQSSIETTIHATDSAADLYHKVMGTLAAAPEPFELRYTGAKPHQILPNSASHRLVRDLGFRGRQMVTLVWSPDASLAARQSPSLKPEFRARATELKVELASQQAQGEAAHQTAMDKGTSQQQQRSGGSKLDVEAKMKKFLGFGGKKR